jgi:hypothetical protein
LEDELLDLAAQISAEDEEAPVETEEIDEGEETEPAEAEETEPQQEETPEEEPSLDDKISGIARQEATFRVKMERERAEFEEQKAAWEKEVSERKASWESQEAAVAAFREDPVAFLEDVPLKDRVAIAEDIYNSVLGPDAPADWRSRRESRKAETRVQKLERQLAERDAAEARAKEQAALQAKLDEYGQELTQGAESLELPHVKAIIAHDKAKAQSALLAMASKHAEEKGEKMTAEQAAKALEGYLEEMLAPFKSLMSPPAGTVTASGSKTLSSKNSAQRTRRAPTVDDEESLLSAAMQFVGVPNG